MWPIGPPQDSIWRRRNQFTRVRNNVVVRRRTVRGESLCTGNLDPAPFVAHQSEQCLERFLGNASRSDDAGHVVDDVRRRHRIEQRRIRRQILCVEVQHDMPVPLRDPRDDAPEHRQLGCTAEVGDEVESCCSDAGVMKLLNRRVGKRLIDHCDACVPTATSNERIEHGGIVGAVTARLHEDCVRKS